MTDFELQQLEQQRQRYAQMGQAQAPQGQMVGNTYIAPNALQYIAQGLRGIGGLRGEAQATEQIKEMQANRQKAVADALRNFGTMAQGRPADMLPEDQAGPVRPAQASDMAGAYQALLQAPDQALRQAGMQGMVQMPQLQAQQAERMAERDFRRSEREAMAAQRMEQLQAQHEMRMQMLQDQNATRQQMAEEQRNFQREMAQTRASLMQANAQPYFQPVQTAQGVMAFNARTGRVEPVMGPGGTPVIGAAADPALQGQLAGAKAGASTEAKAVTERRLEAPQVITQGEETIRLVDDLLKSPGFGQAVGASRLLGVQRIPGTAAKDFDIRLDQLKGQQFLQAFESLKGGGQITEVEGKKATDAISRMDAAGSEAEFRKAAKEFQDVIRIGVERARNRVQAPQAAPAQTPRSRIRFDAQGNVIP